MLKQLGIDLGASAIKIVGKVGDKEIFCKVKSLVSTYGKIGENSVELEGQLFHFDAGQPLITRDKTQRQLLIQSIVLSYYKVFGKAPEETELEVAIGLPINIYLAQEKLKSFKEELKKYENYLIDAKVNNENVVLRLKRILVFPEGYSALSSLSKEFSHDNNSIFLDIGYKTTDVLYLLPRDSKNWTINQNFTVDKGMWDVFFEFKNILMNIDIFLSEEDIEQRLLNDFPVKVKNEKKNLKDILFGNSPVLDSIINQIELNIADFKNCDIHLGGGGSIFAYDILHNKISNLQLMKDTDKLVFANAIGYLQQLEEGPID